MIKSNSDWSPYLKATASYLMPRGALKNVTFADLEGIDFVSWPADKQKGFLSRLVLETKGFDLDKLLQNKVFQNVSDKIKICLVKKFDFIKTGEDFDKLSISSNIEKMDFLNIFLDERGNLKQDSKTENKFFNCFLVLIKKFVSLYNEKMLELTEAGDNSEEAIKEIKKLLPSTEEIKKIDGFTNLRPEEKFVMFTFSRDLKISDIEKIENADKITDLSFLYNIGTEMCNFTDFNLASVLKSKLPLFIKVAFFNFMKFEDSISEKGEITLYNNEKKAAAFKLVTYPYGIDLLFQKILETDKKLIDKDLNQIESMLLECITSAQTLSGDLELEKEDIAKLVNLRKKIDKNKNKSLKDRFNSLEVFVRVLLNILEVPLSVFPFEFAKKARKFFFDPRLQMKNNDFTNRKKEISDVLSKAKSQVKKEK